ncbi:Ferredoxin--sulfite reductase [Arcticibacter svalbardensis MN12-7]|uniref:Ferredoxin--sulfite reductase n=1 Tax=Arcticibacter svalbardensis MN12-7 TaxID=1150600 RepID=R9GZ76_9SPHI|nr:HEPN domain-containing protein [Arcticibacter svalbardensis]EOR94269.1 Ferredoxin--sulfite reductase [Arcticibacter svalbardensis MN12-7]
MNESHPNTVESIKSQEDIDELKEAISAFKKGDLSEDQFRSMRTLKGVYSQRQAGGQMVRIKLPFGRVTFRQMLLLADISETYSDGLIHFTTRQDIQIYNVSLERIPELWNKLETVDITLRGSGGNSVRNVTATALAGIDPKEPFDVSPYAYIVFKYFLHNPVCQEMGRKIKISFSSSEEDTGLSFIHDLGFLPRLRQLDGVEQRGFKVLIGGGLGAQPLLAQEIKDFLPEDQLIPFIESVLRVFNSYGERKNKNRSRLKYFVREIGLKEMLVLIEQQIMALPVKSLCVDRNCIPLSGLHQHLNEKTKFIPDTKYNSWFKTNVFEQKQGGCYGIYIKLQPGGDIKSDKLRKLVSYVKNRVADDIRVTGNQNLVLRFVKKEDLTTLFAKLNELGLAESGAGSLLDLMSCRGSKTCNLAISNSLGLAQVLEDLFIIEYKDLMHHTDIKVKISGCMNSCGHHAIASIGLHGSSLRADNKVLPAVQILIGGGILGNGEGRFADKIIKIPVRRAPDALRLILNHYRENVGLNESFFDYYDRYNKGVYYTLLKPLSDLSNLTHLDFIDWGYKETYKTAIGTGECAGETVDLTYILLQQAYDKIDKAKNTFDAGLYADSIHHAYTSLINTAKALLLTKGISSSSQHNMISDFDTHFALNEDFSNYETFKDLVQQINQNEPEEGFAERYLEDAISFVQNHDLITNGN